MSRYKGQFEGNLAFLSNMFRIDIEYEGLIYPSSENLYQALKLRYPQLRVDFTKMDPYQSKRVWRKRVYAINPNFDRLEAMKLVIDVKFSNQHMQDLLIQTDPFLITEINNWNDTFWGICNDVGEDNLGKILRAKREELLNAKSET